MENKKISLDSKVEELRNQLNRAEMLSEMENANVLDTARYLLTDRFTECLEKDLEEFLGHYSIERSTQIANDILSRLELPAMSSEGCTDISQVMDRFLEIISKSADRIGTRNQI